VARAAQEATTRTTEEEATTRVTGKANTRGRTVMNSDNTRTTEGGAVRTTGKAKAKATEGEGIRTTGKAKFRATEASDSLFFLKKPRLFLLISQDTTVTV